MHVSVDSAIPYLIMYSTDTSAHVSMCKIIHWALFLTVKVQKQSKRLSKENWLNKLWYYQHNGILCICK